MATAHIEDPIVNACNEEQMPVVLVNRTTDAGNVSAVVNNDELGIQLAVSHLVELGHTRIAFLGGPENTSTGRDRRQAFETHGNNGCFELDKELVTSCAAFTEEAGREGMSTILDKHKDINGRCCRKRHAGARLLRRIAGTQTVVPGDKSPLPASTTCRSLIACLHH